MKNLITPSYIFTPGVSGVGTIQTNIANFDIKLLLAIINVTRETIIYSSALSGKGYTAISDSTITLEFDTSTYSSTDILQTFYDSTPDYPGVVVAPRINNLAALLQRLVKISETLQVVDQQQRQRIAIDSIASGVTLPTVTTVTTVSTVSTVSAVTNVASNAGMDREQYINIAKQTYAQSIRQGLKIQ